MDEERHRISLGMKDSYMTNNYENQSPTKQELDDIDHADSDKEGTQTDMLDNDSPGSKSLDIEYENAELPVLADVEARASILPLEVPLNDIEDSTMDNICERKEQAVDAELTEERNERRKKKKAREER